MPKIVILGSSRFAPYVLLAVPDRIIGGSNDDLGYEIASQTFYPAIDEADLIILYAPDGIGEHTQRDLDYARRKGKTVYRLVEMRNKKAGGSRRD